MAADCMFVTCADVGDLDPDDRLVLDELEQRGFSTTIGVWNDARIDWSSVRLSVLRSTWDYHRHYRAFIAWIDRAAALTAIRNDPHLLRWNADKAYLFELEAVGVPIVPSVRVACGDRSRLAEISMARGWHDVVVKPSRGAAAHDVLVVKTDATSRRAGQEHLDRLSQAQGALVQPYLRSVETYGERALIFFEGRYSHAAEKKPFDTVWIVNGAESAAVTPTAIEVEIATKALAALPSVPLYARVDLLRGDGGETYVGEVELVEPGLYIGAHAPAKFTFADAIERELRALS